MILTVALLGVFGFYLDRPRPITEDKPKFAEDQRVFSKAMLYEVQQGIIAFERQMQDTVRGGKICIWQHN